MALGYTPARAQALFASAARGDRRRAVGGRMWLRPGKTTCGGKITALFLDLWENQPGHLRLRGVRANASVCLPKLLALWETLRLPYMVEPQLRQPIQKLIKGGLVWGVTEAPGTKVAELEHQSMNWPRPRRLALIRRRMRVNEGCAGKRLLDVLGCHFQASVTSLPAATHPLLAVWRY